MSTAPTPELAQAAPQQMQVVVAKTAAELEAERRIAIAKAQRVEIARAIFADEVKENEEDNESRHENDYNRVVVVGDQTWVATWGHYSKHYLHHETGQPEGRIVFISHREMKDAEGNGDQLDDNYCAINVTELFGMNKRAEISSLIMGLAKAEDEDVNYTLDVIMRYGSFDIEWPAEDATANALSMSDLYILVSRAKKAGTVMFDRDNGTIGLIEKLRFVPAGMFNPDYIRWTTNMAISRGGKLIRATQDGLCADLKVYGKDLAIRPATEQQIADAIAKGKATHARLSGENGEGFAHLHYKGVGYTPGYFGMRVPHSVESRVVVDPEGLRLMDQSRMNALTDLMGVDVVEKDRSTPLEIEQPTEIDFAGVVNMAVMYDLAKSIWLIGYVENMSEIVYREDAFDRLVLDSQRKRLVEALVVHNGTIREGTPDIIDGKGGGCIFLLDGPPGTGKTLTAEATAEKLNRVLYKVGLGELGVDAPTMEKKLSQILSTAARWNAVLLLDEADVFLEKRSTENLARNAMVAVFLRLMEYYNGILFLTTNRGDNFDPAVLSRVTLALHFRAQDAEGRAVIWRNLLANAGITVSKSELASLGGLAVNGREIKNAINSSRALAAADKTEVTYQHLREILDASVLFQQEVHGPDSAKR